LKKRLDSAIVQKYNESVNLSHILIRGNKMNNRMLYPVMLLVGVGIGTGVGMLISKPEIDKGQKEIDQLRAQIQISKTDSEERIQRATTEIARSQQPRPSLRQ
jgi:hypothetical protein